MIVSGADDREATQANTNNGQQALNAHTTTNTDIAIVDTNIKTQDKKDVTSDILLNSRQDNIGSYSTWSTNENQVDKQYLRVSSIMTLNFACV